MIKAIIALNLIGIFAGIYSICKSLSEGDYAVLAMGVIATSINGWFLMCNLEECSVSK